jgi:hypothetical protein
MPISHCYAIEIFENDDRVFPEEFLRELAAAQVQHIQKLARRKSMAKAPGCISRYFGI